jgi:putative addiction module component (TIGR02574 family)
MHDSVDPRNPGAAVHSGGSATRVDQERESGYSWNMSEIPLSELLALSLPERAQLAADLWDSVADEAEAHPERLPVSQAQAREIMRRSRAYHQNPGRAVPLHEALDRIERSLG